MDAIGLEAAAALARAALYLGLTVATGVVLVAWTGATRSHHPPDAAARTVWGPALIGTLLLSSAPLLLLELQRQALELTRAELPILLVDTPWGPHWMQLAAACLMTAVAIGVLGWSAHLPHATYDRQRRGVVAAGAHRLAAVGVVAVAATMSGLGHAAADSEWPRLSRVADSLHAVTAATWIGGLALTAWITHGRADDESGAAWGRFSRVATVAAPIVLLSALVSSWRRLGAQDPDALWQAMATPYGRLLAVKGGLVLVMLAIGARQRQRLQAGKQEEPRAIRAELLFALLVFGVTSVLTGTEPPAQRP